MTLQKDRLSQNPLLMHLLLKTKGTNTKMHMLMSNLCKEAASENTWFHSAKSNYLSQQIRAPCTKKSLIYLFNKQYLRSSAAPFVQKLYLLTDEITVCMAWMYSVWTQPLRYLRAISTVYFNSGVYPPQWITDHVITCTNLHCKLYLNKTLS